MYVFTDIKTDTYIYPRNTLLRLAYICIYGLPGWLRW